MTTNRFDDFYFSLRCAPVRYDHSLRFFVYFTFLWTLKIRFNDKKQDTVKMYNIMFLYEKSCGGPNADLTIMIYITLQF